ncbi:imidazole glycerol phosphate synthase subunit HisH [Sulfitobacter sp. JL08]|uniref:imidazole glycerol phosphate synthase subunit HisH n=1 Tax=Sulfitobacter sp. JL08 TaxID=2070369 RepID=UPI000E0A5041|nr:imidazole glycerol phosphate synthase subunit HisH [Sulfitobacter sp. JL08]AXI54106.1 imidazole glycerol phosphate synthase subunit HisH [Sulfitobacter sp. JL08]
MPGPLIIDYGCGNPASIGNMLKKIGIRSEISADADAIRTADSVIFPGVGAFDYGAERIMSLGIAEALEERVRGAGIPLLGICVGMQLLARKSEEGALPGLGWIEADVVAFDKSRLGKSDKVPHMGWADLSVRKPSGLLHDFHEDPRFYFVHSFHFSCDHEEDVAATAHHGYDFCAAIARDNIWGVQFHPEKSHRFGMALFRNFIEATER